MSRTVRNIKWAKEKGIHQGRIQKLGLHRACMNHKKVGKLALGPGGINCACCLKVKPDKVKVAFRRWERHTAPKFCLDTDFTTKED